ncbi:MAG: methylenetetrahydrofolate reductase [NAD(P)H] [Rhodospirillaceae bacterium]|nr:methylenetetrahydrofolate reductase [NAD(P)H] [Rhodospirillaceae bacterium]
MARIPRVSFEFFPPRDDAGWTQLWATIEKLAPFGPAFVSVTYGAGGTTRERTDRIVRRIRGETALEPAAHLTCVGADTAEIDALAQSWWQAGIRHVVALRGDAPAGQGRFLPHPAGYANAAALVAGLRRIAEFDIAVAAYPESHPESPSEAADLDNLKRKIDAGASTAITQFFFEAETFLRFRDRAAAAGIRAPLVPGILPITNFARAVDFAQRCGASVPAALATLFEGLDDDPEQRQLVAAATASGLCERLAAEGVDRFHFYTLNRPQLTAAICRRLGLKPLREAA